MSIPTLDKTWEHKVNVATGGLATTLLNHQDFYFKIKEALVNGAGVPGSFTSPWTVWGSSDGSVYGNNDGVDRWASGADIVFNTSGSHSWFVFNNTAFSPTLQFCVDLNTASTQRTASLVISVDGSFGTAGGGTDGSLTARPTAATEYLYNSVDDGTQYAPWTGYLHMMMSDDGECTRVLLSRDNGDLTTVLILDKPRSPIAEWTNPVLWTFRGHGGTSGNVLTYSYYNEAANLRGRIGSDDVSFYATSPSYYNDAIGQKITVPDDNTGQWPFIPMGLACSTLGHRGVRKASIYDLWWTSTGTIYGTTFPDDASYQFAQMGDVIFPWNGTKPLIS
jgi:hypothetical protein